MSNKISIDYILDVLSDLEVAALLVNDSSQLIDCNRTFYQLTNYSKQQIGNNDFERFFTTKAIKRLKEVCAELQENDADYRLLSDLELVTAAKELRLVDLTLHQLKNEGQFLLTLELNHYHRSNLERINMYQAIFNNTQDAIFLLRVDNKQEFRFQLLNPTYEELTGLSTEEVRDKTPQEVFGLEVGSELANNYQQCLEAEETISYEEELETPKGKKWWATKLSPVFDEEEVVQIVGSARDITEIKENEQRIKNISFRDQLTGLYNRRYYEQELEQYNVESELPISLIIGDVNGLKITNDIFGHQAGDRLLREVAQIIEANVREDDIVARWGGDEFGILLPNTSQEKSYRILERIKQAFKTDDFDLIPISVAFGVATKVKGDKDIEAVFRNAEDQMYENKEVIKSKFNNRLLQSLSNKLEESNYNIVNHTLQMANLGMRFADKLELTDSKKELLELAIEFHDIGKLALEDNINDSLKLTSEHLKKFKRHSKLGYKVANYFKVLNPVADVILSHHEYWDGSGYPEGLSGEEIPYLARIVAILDFYDALTYQGINHDLDLITTRRKLNQEAALKLIESYGGKYFDPDLTEKFIDLMVD
ncbi:MAG: diguanylate cyclase [Bacillota bacterium]